MTAMRCDGYVGDFAQACATRQRRTVMRKKAEKPVVFDLQGHFLECGQMVRAIYERVMASDDVQSMIQAAKMIQRQTVIEARVLEIATRSQAVMEFQAGVLEALEGAGITVQRRIIGMFDGK